MQPQEPTNQQPYGAPQPGVQPNYGQYGPAPAVSGVDASLPSVGQPEPAYQAPPLPQAVMPQAPPPFVPQPQAPYQQPTAYGPQPGVYGGTPGQPAPQVKPVVKSNPNSTQNTLQIAEVRDGIAIMSDGSFRSVVMVKSINFDLMSPEEREAVEFSYQGFLNSLYFEIQIFIRSQRVDLRPYIERLDKIRSEHDNMLLALLMEDYIGFVSDISAQTNIMDKRFYVVIPYFASDVSVQKALSQSKNFFSGLSGIFNNKEHHVTVNEQDLNKAKDELRNRVQAVLGGLQQCGIQGLPLDTQELIELFYDSYNPDTATRQQLKNFNALTAPVVQKGQGMAPQPNLERTLQ